MNALCAIDSGLLKPNGAVALPTPTGFTVNNSISIPLDSDPDLVLHYSFNGDILDYGSSTSLNTNLGPTIGVYDASFVPFTGSTVSLSSNRSIFNNGTSLLQSASNNTSYLSITNIPTNSAGYSFSFWINFTSNTTGAIFSFANAYDTNVDRIVIWNSSGTLYFGCNNVFYNNLAIFPPLNTWSHFVWTLDTTGKTNIYVNGVLTVVNNATVPYKSFIFNYNWILGDTLRGINQYGALAYMNDFRYYNRILDIYEVKQLFNLYFNNILNPTYTTPSSNFYLNTDISLALYYPFNNNLTNFKTGTAGTLTGSTALNYSNVKVGTGSLYNSTASTTNYFTPAAITNTRSGWTFSCWIYLSSTPTSSVNATSAIWYFGLNVNGSTGGHLYLTISNSLQLYMNQGLVSGGAPAATYFIATITTTQWYHVVITADIANNTIYYINSVNIGNTPGTANPVLNSFGISNAVGALSRNSLFGINAIVTSGYNTPPRNYPGMPGYIDDFRVYNRPLTQSEITMLYSYNNYPMSTLNLNTDPSLCLYYTFDLSRNSVYNYAQNVYGTVDASYVNGARTNYADLTYVGTGGLKLLGTNSGYVQLLPTSVVNTTNFIRNNGMTFACWFYSSDSSNNATIFNFGTETGDDIILSIFTNRILCKLLNTGTFYSLNSPATYNKSFRHIVWTMSYSVAATSTWNIYIDASRVNTISTNKYPNQVARNTNYLGRSNISSDPSFNGYIDDFRVYQRVLTQAEITQIYTYTNTLNVKSANLSWTAANTTKTPLTYNYFYKDNSLNITPNILSYFSGLSWTAFYGVIDDYTSIASTTTANSFQTISRYSGGSNTKTSSSSNALTNINYPNTTIASTNNIFGFDNTNGNGDNGYFISLVITGYFKPTLTGIWNFQFASAGVPNDDFSIFWINDGANVNETRNHWPPTDTNFNILPPLTIDPNLLYFYTFNNSDLSSNLLKNQATGLYNLVIDSGVTVDGTLNVPFNNTGQFGSEFVEAFTLNNSGFTIGLWIKLNSLSTVYIYTFGVNTTDRTDTISLVKNSSGFNFRIDNGPLTEQVITTIDGNSIDINIWYHLVWNVVGTTWKIYANGVLTTYTGKVGVTELTKTYNKIGKSFTNNDTQFFSGQIDGFFVYNSNLTQNQVSDIYSKGQNPSPTNYYYTIPIVNYIFSNYSTTLFADVYYPIQITWSESSGNSTLGFQFQPPGGSYTTDGTGYFFSQSSTPVNTSSTNSVINNLLDGNGITYSVNSQVDTKQSKYVSVTK